MNNKKEIENMENQAEIRKSKLNRKERRFMMFHKATKYISKLFVKDANNNESEKAYLHPTKGWKGNKKVVKNAGYKTRQKTKVGK